MYARQFHTNSSLKILSLLLVFFAVGRAIRNIRRIPYHMKFRYDYFKTQLSKSFCCSICKLAVFVLFMRVYYHENHLNSICELGVQNLRYPASPENLPVEIHIITIIMFLILVKF